MALLWMSFCLLNQLAFVRRERLANRFIAFKCYGWVFGTRESPELPAWYQIAEIARFLQTQKSKDRIHRNALIQAIGGYGATAITHILRS
jgi:hypothetical protein